MKNKQNLIILILSIVLVFFIWDRFSSPNSSLRSQIKDLEQQIEKIDGDRKILEEQRYKLELDFKKLEEKSGDQQKKIDSLKNMSGTSEEEIKKAQEIIRKNKREDQTIQDEINQLIKNPKILQGDSLINSLRQKLNF